MQIYAAHLSKDAVLDSLLLELLQSLSDGSSVPLQSLFRNALRPHAVVHKRTKSEALLTSKYCTKNKQ